MPLYDYQCPTCQMIKEVRHSMSELDNPSEETLRKISCNENTCSRLNATQEPYPQPHILFIRQVSVPALNKFDTAPASEKKKILQKRSNDHFQKEIRERKMFMDGKTGKQA